ncbi:MAG: hypothetical protein ACRCU3_02735 [Eubacteriaceae bacterium]
MGLREYEKDLVDMIEMYRAARYESFFAFGIFAFLKENKSKIKNKNELINTAYERVNASIRRMQNVGYFFIDKDGLVTKQAKIVNKEVTKDKFVEVNNKCFFLHLHLFSDISFYNVNIDLARNRNHLIFTNKEKRFQLTILDEILDTHNQNQYVIDRLKEEREKDFTNIFFLFQKEDYKRIDFSGMSGYFAVLKDEGYKEFENFEILKNVKKVGLKKFDFEKSD